MTEENKKYLLCLSYYDTCCQLRRRHIVTKSVKEAVTTYKEWRDREGLGSRDMGHCYIRQNGIIIADISYNSRITYTEGYLVKYPSVVQGVS